MHLTNAILNAQFSVTRITVAHLTVAEFSGCPLYRLPSRLVVTPINRSLENSASLAQLKSNLHIRPL